MDQVDKDMLIFFGVVFLSTTIIVFSFLCMAGLEECDSYSYLLLKQSVEEYPELSDMIQEASADGKTTFYEFYSIRGKYKELEKKGL